MLPTGHSKPGGQPLKLDAGRWRASLLIVCAALALLLAAAARADYLVVSRNATLKAEPSGEAAIVSSLEPGDTLLLVETEQTSGYYRAQVPGGAGGWVYRTLVRRYTGEPAAPAAPMTPPAPGGLTPAEEGYAARHLRLGKPVVLYERFRQGYALAEDGRLKIPLWVQYELSPGELEGPASRQENFRPDLSIPAGYRAELEDYQGSGWDRGHMAPAADMTRSDEVMGESFLLSNMSPQNSTLNRGLWANLEEAVRGWVRQRGTLTVITGPVFEPEQARVSYRLIGPHHVAVPTHFYKIVVDARNSSAVQALAFLVPNQAPGGRDLQGFLTSIDRIEAVTGIDFLSELPDSQEAAVESRVAQGLW
jgi:endonuclease G